jgi:hypothetical protein
VCERDTAGGRPRRGLGHSTRGMMQAVPIGRDIHAMPGIRMSSLRRTSQTTSRRGKRTKPCPTWRGLDDSVSQISVGGGRASTRTRRLCSRRSATFRRKNTLIRLVTTLLFPPALMGSMTTMGGGDSNASARMSTQHRRPAPGVS